jgi:dephospho-CoA kinase
MGLTGGIGSGKSTVSGLLAARGAVIVDADRIAREVVEPGTPGLAAVAEAFGPRVLAPDGSLDRPALAALVFADPEARRRLDGIVHPLVRERAGELAAAAPAGAVVVHDVPLLVETGQGASYDLVRLDDEDQVVGRPLVGLHQQRHVVDHDRACRRGSGELTGPPADQRVDDPVQPAAGVRVREHDRGQLGAVQCPVGGQHPRPERVHDGGQTWRAGPDHLAGDLVGVHDHGAAAGHEPRHGALPGPDPAGQPHTHVRRVAMQPSQVTDR